MGWGESLIIRSDVTEKTFVFMYKFFFQLHICLFFMWSIMKKRNLRGRA